MTYYDSPLVLTCGIAFLTSCSSRRQIAQTTQWSSATSFADNACQSLMASKTSTTHVSATMTSSNFRTTPRVQTQLDNFQQVASISRTIILQQQRNVQMLAHEHPPGQQRLAPSLMRIIAHECALGHAQVVSNMQCTRLCGLTLACCRLAAQYPSEANLVQVCLFCFKLKSAANTRINAEQKCGLTHEVCCLWPNQHASKIQRNHHRASIPELDYRHSLRKHPSCVAQLVCRLSSSRSQDMSPSPVGRADYTCALASIDDAPFAQCSSHLPKTSKSAHFQIACKPRESIRLATIRKLNNLPAMFGLCRQQLSATCRHHCPGTAMRQSSSSCVDTLMASMTTMMHDSPTCGNSYGSLAKSLSCSLSVLKFISHLVS